MSGAHSLSTARANGDADASLPPAVAAVSATEFGDSRTWGTDGARSEENFGDSRTDGHSLKSEQNLRAAGISGDRALLCVPVALARQ